MFVLSIISGPTKGQSIRLLQGGSISIGSGWDATFHFDDPALAEMHAEVSWTDEGFSLLDLSTKTGTMVNGSRIKSRVALRVGDHVQMGALIFQLKEVAAAQEETADYAVDQTNLAEEPPKKSKILSIDSQVTEIAQRSLMLQKTEALLLLRGHTVISAGLDAPTLDGEFAARASALRAFVSSPESVGRAKIVVSRDGGIDPFSVMPITIGREQTNTIVLDDPGVSVRHAVVELRQGKYILRDAGSSNGIYVNGKRIVERKIEDGDLIVFGSHTLVAVHGSVCLGLEVQPPSLIKRTAEPRSDTKKVVVPEALASAPKKKKKKKASELVWYATSDLDKGVFRARAAIIALVLGVAATGAMLAGGDSETLAGSRLAAHHEDETFVAAAEGRERDRCTACHVGVGQVSTLKCLDCHAEHRPSRAHAEAEIGCTGCHLEHRGAEFRSSPAAAMTCTSCHPAPHEKLIRERPKLVANFSIDAPAGVDFHLSHQANGVACLTCHGSQVQTADRGVRGACRQCHAPDHVTAEDCQMCHRAHPDRNIKVDLKMVAAVAPPRFAGKAFLFAFGVLFVSFAGAALIPRKRKVDV
jgi:pSer/pThr/pTyr-binding forkhead associated (FHA) protein